MCDPENFDESLEVLVMDFQGKLVYGFIEDKAVHSFAQFLIRQGLSHLYAHTQKCIRIERRQVYQDS